MPGWINRIIDWLLKRGPSAVEGYDEFTTHLMARVKALEEAAVLERDKHELQLANERMLRKTLHDELNRYWKRLLRCERDLQICTEDREKLGERITQLEGVLESMKKGNG